MPRTREQLTTAIRTLEAQRAALGEAVFETAVAPLRDALRMLDSQESTPEPALRQVSILFLDVVGSTSMSSRLDTEDIHSVLEGALQQFTDVARRHEGRLLRYAGDSMLTVFGAEGAREDDAERAVRCGLALIEAARAYRDRMATERGLSGFDVRVGVHTGAIMQAPGVEGDSTVHGQAINVAARMEQSAPAGGLRISHDTYAQVRGVFDVVPELVTVKGVDHPLQSYVVTGIKPRAFRVRTRGIEGVETRMVGRERELDRLQTAFLRVTVGRRAMWVGVIGDAGLGKSRLLYEFDQWAEMHPQAFFHFEGRATPRSEGEPYGLLKDIVFRRFDIDDTDTVDQARGKLERGLAPLFPEEDGRELAEVQTHALAHLLGLVSPADVHAAEEVEQLRNRGILASLQMFRRFADTGERPLLLEIEDLQWADEPSLDLLERLFESSADLPLLVIATARPTLYERRPKWRRMDAVVLDPLDRGSSRMLAAELLKRLPQVPEALRELLIGRADGNPFHMEELVRMLVDQGAIDTRGEAWSVQADKLVAASVPTTLAGIIQTRLDGLPPIERRALQWASVIGPVFWDQALTSLDAELARTLVPLTTRELIVPRPGTTLEGFREYAFAHHILHQVTYETTLKATRRVVHERIADWLAPLAGRRAGDFLATIAAHYESAGKPAQACEFLARAAEDASRRFAHASVLGYTRHALELLGSEPGGNQVLEGRLLTLQFEALRRLGLDDEERRVLDLLLANADAQGDPAAVARARTLQADFLWRRGQPGPSAEAARQALEAARRSGDTLLRLDATSKLAAALFNSGEQDPAIAMVEDALDEARKIGAQPQSATLMNMRAIFAAAADDVVTSLELGREHLALQRSLGNRVMEAMSLANVGTNLLDLGAYEEARQHLLQALRLARIVGPKEIEGWTLYLLSSVELALGDAEQALVLARSAHEIALAVGLPNRELSALLALGDAYLALGRLDEAARSFDQAALVSDVNSPTEHFDALAGSARVALARGGLDAQSIVEPIVDHVLRGEPLTHAEVPRLILWTCYRVLDHAGDPRAVGVLAAAYTSVMERAQSISDGEYRAAFLQNIAEHRAIVGARG